MKEPNNLLKLSLSQEKFSTKVDSDAIKTINNDDGSTFQGVYISEKDMYCGLKFRANLEGEFYIGEMDSNFKYHGKGILFNNYRENQGNSHSIGQFVNGVLEVLDQYSQTENHVMAIDIPIINSQNPIKISPPITSRPTKIFPIPNTITKKERTLTKRRELHIRTRSHVTNFKTTCNNLNMTKNN